jgi:diaminobutyrate-2-oxoglutarate transaminase
MFHPLAKAVKGHRKLRVAIAENQDFTTGITEAESIARFFRKRFIKTECVDARRFEAHSQYAVAYRGKPVDVVYRNIELRDLADLEAAGGNLAGLRAAAQAGKMLSSPFGELDHKSLWEALGSDEFADLFTTDERQLIAQHVPWTRLLRDRKTDNPAGKIVDLPEYVRHSRADLVLKPNRSCGGQGVTIGRMTSAAQWESTLSAALEAPDLWVVQERIPIPRRLTCRLTEEGRFEPDEVFSVFGGFNSVAGPGFVGRASHSPVVNVMQGGGLLAVMGKMPKEK